MDIVKRLEARVNRNPTDQFYGISDEELDRAAIVEIVRLRSVLRDIWEDGMQDGLSNDLQNRVEHCLGINRAVEQLR